jgi:isobutyryl-CoA mutase
MQDQCRRRHPDALAAADPGQRVTQVSEGRAAHLDLVVVLASDQGGMVEEAVLAELERISERGGVLGAMETGYQRGKIQDESMLYERRKHDGSLPVIGVNTFRNPSGDPVRQTELARATEDEKRSQLDRVRDFQMRHEQEAHTALAALKDTARGGGNMFAALMDAARVCSLQQITEAFFEVGGQYRRNV